jgi:uncharacterized SAM-binding protein YcdF (DUF218 family)
MNLVDSGRRVGLGATAGALIALLLYHLHVGPIFGNPDLIGAIVGGLAVGGAAAAFGWERWLLTINALLIFVYFIVTDSPAMGQIADRWVRDDGPPGPRDAIVVLSAYVQPDSAIDAEATERLLSGLELYKAGIAPRMVTSRVEASDGGIRRSSSADVRQLLDLAGATTGWIEVDSVSSTRDEAVRMAAALLPQGIARIALVTSAFHTRRACATFEAVGFVVSCQAARDRAVMKRHPTNSASRLAAFGDYVYERLGMIKYRRMGWLPPTR